MTRFLALLAVFLALPVAAQDGAILDARLTSHVAEATFYLCDGDHSTVGCSEFDLGGSLGFGVPDVLTFAYEKATGCTTDVLVRGLSGIAGAAHTYTLSLAGTSSVTFELPRFVRWDATIASPTGCTDVEVLGIATWRLERAGGPP